MTPPFLTVDIYTYNSQSWPSQTGFCWWQTWQVSHLLDFWSDQCIFLTLGSPPTRNLKYEIYLFNTKYTHSRNNHYIGKVFDGTGLTSFTTCCQDNRRKSIIGNQTQISRHIRKFLRPSFWWRFRTTTFCKNTTIFTSRPYFFDTVFSVISLLLTWHVRINCWFFPLIFL